MASLLLSLNGTLLKTEVDYCLKAREFRFKDMMALVGGRGRREEMSRENSVIL